MELKSFDHLPFSQLDVLKEIGNIGMGNAATALSQMLQTKVEMAIPEVQLLDTEQAEIFLDRLQQNSLGIILQLSGDAKGMIVHVLRKSFAQKIIGFFFQSCIESIEDIDEMSLSVISEVGNITSAAYVNAIASMTGLFIDISTPTPCKSLSESVVKTEQTKNCLLGGKLMFVNTSFFIDDVEIKSNLIFLPETSTLRMIFEKMGYELQE